MKKILPGWLMAFSTGFSLVIVIGVLVYAVLNVY
jgi:hypothetical protein